MTLAVLALSMVAVGFVKSITGQLDKDDGYSKRARLFGPVPLGLDELEADADKLLAAQKVGGDISGLFEEFNRECQLADLDPGVVLLNRSMCGQ